MVAREAKTTLNELCHLKADCQSLDKEMADNCTLSETQEAEASLRRDVGMSSVLHAHLSPIVNELSELEKLSKYLLWIKRIGALRYTIIHVYVRYPFTIIMLFNTCTFKVNIYTCRCLMHVHAHVRVQCMFL